MPLVTKGPFYVEDYKFNSHDYGDHPIVDIVIGHPDAFRIVVHIESRWPKKDKVTIHTEW